MPSVHAVIVTHNSAPDVQSQLRCGPLWAGFDTVVFIDNASTDGTPEIIHDAGFDVRVLHHNPGFAAAINVGANLHSGEILTVLNPDILVDEADMLRRLAEQVLTEPRLGVIAPSLMLGDGSLQDSARDVPAPADLFRRRLLGVDTGRVEAEEPRDVDWLVGALMVIRRDAFDEVGGFDERFRLYFEDVDFCVRLWKRGWRTKIIPGEYARHAHRGTSRSTWVGSAMRRHLRSAARFYEHHPAMIFERGRRSLRWADPPDRPGPTDAAT